MQRRLDELRESLSGDEIGRLAARLNRPGSDRVAAMWEATLLHALSQCGRLESEKPLPSGRRPDVYFDNGDVTFTADITSVSDDGLDADNPYFELSQLIERAKGKLGLPIGGLDVQVKARHDRSARGLRTVLRLPPRTQLHEFVQRQVIPRLREQMAAGETVLRLSFDDDFAGLDISIDPATSPYSSGGFAAYDVPTIKDRNPLYNALKSKAGQLRGADGLAGVIVGDGDCTALAERPERAGNVSAIDIAQEFLRQYSSIGFVLLLTVRGAQQARWSSDAPRRWVHPVLVTRPNCDAQPHLASLFDTMIGRFPIPIASPTNGALRAHEPGYELGHHGGYSMGGRTIRMSARELIETLAGLRSLADEGAVNSTAQRQIPPNPHSLQAAFLRHLEHGRLPVASRVIASGDDDNDDWIEFEFGDPDPAISPFR